MSRSLQGHVNAKATVSLIFMTQSLKDICLCKESYYLCHQCYLEHLTRNFSSCVSWLNKYGKECRSTVLRHSLNMVLRAKCYFKRCCHHSSQDTPPLSSSWTTMWVFWVSVEMNRLWSFRRLILSKQARWHDIFTLSLNVLCNNTQDYKSRSDICPLQDVVLHIYWIY